MEEKGNIIPEARNRIVLYLARSRVSLLSDRYISQIFLENFEKLI